VSQSQGRPLRLSHADIARWHSHLVMTATCHIWMGAVGSDGYGRLAINNKQDGSRMLTPHQVAARIGFGPIPAGATLLHHCEVRLCCNYDPRHVQVGTQGENMRQAVARGRAVGPRPGRVDVRGKVGASRAIQAALRAAVDRSPAALARVLADVIAEGDPMAGIHPLFDLAGLDLAEHPSRPAAEPAFTVPVTGPPARTARRTLVESLPLFAT
jgi:hypothetical protein